MKKIFLINVFFLTFLGIFGISAGEVFAAWCNVTTAPSPATVEDDVKITITGGGLDPDSLAGVIWGYELFINRAPTAFGCSSPGNVAVENLTCSFTKKFTTPGNYFLQCSIILSGGGLLSGSKNLTVNSAASTYALSVSKAGTGEGTVASNVGGIDCGATCAATYNSGTSVTLTASPLADSVFSGWSGGGCSGTGPCNITMDAAKSAVATFIANSPGSGPGPGPVSGTVQCAASSINTSDLKTYRVGNRMVAYDGLVPCGKCSLVDVNTDSDGKYLSGGTPTDIPCQLCHIFVMIKGIMDFLLLKLVPIIAVLLFTVGGIMYIVARGNPSQITQAKSILTSAVVGLVIIFASWVIINTIFTLTGLMNPDLGWDLTKWFEVSCNITLPAQAQ